MHTYTNVVAVFGASGPFANVAQAEQEHAQTIQQLAAAHGVALPTGNFPGANAPATLSAACQLGVTTEQNIIAFYKGILPIVSGYNDLTKAFDNLLSASETSHLPAFQHCA